MLHETRWWGEKCRVKPIYTVKCSSHKLIPHFSPKPPPKRSTNCYIERFPWSVDELSKLETPKKDKDKVKAWIKSQKWKHPKKKKDKVKGNKNSHWTVVMYAWKIALIVGAYTKTIESFQDSDSNSKIFRMKIRILFKILTKVRLTLPQDPRECMCNRFSAVKERKSRKFFCGKSFPLFRVNFFPRGKHQKHYNFPWIHWKVFSIDLSCYSYQISYLIWPDKQYHQPSNGWIYE